MRTTIKIMMIATLLFVASFSAQAQKPIPAINQAYDSFIQTIINDDKATISASNSKYENGGYHQKYTFSLKGNKLKLVENYAKVLQQNLPLAYASFIKDAGSDNDDEMTIYYGENNNERIKLGHYKERNYRVIKINDRKDTTMHYIYTLSWYKENKELKGTAYKFYLRKGKEGKKNNWNTYYFDDNVMSKIKKTTKENEDGSTTTIYDNGNGQTSSITKKTNEDGSVTTIYGVNGNEVSSITSKVNQDGSITTIYDSNGNVNSITKKRNDDGSETTIYKNNGSVTTITKSKKGTAVSTTTTTSR